MMNNNNNKNKIPVRDSNNKNIIVKEDSINDRFCKHCFLQLVPRINEPSIYSCPRCNTTATKLDTYPQTQLRTTFPIFNPTDISTKKHVLQSNDQKLPRSELYFIKRQMERNKVEGQDPYLKTLKSRNDLHITNVEYFSYDDDDDYDDLL